MPFFEANRTTPRRDGFTLVEIVIALLILAMGMMAALSMQFSALGGAGASKDLAVASDLSHRIVHIMNIEAQQWRNGRIGDSVKDAAFDWDHGTILRIAEQSNGEWERIFDEPVDARLSASGNQRYCAYVRGDYMRNLRSSGTREENKFRAHVAVVYPSQSRPVDEECPESDLTDDLLPERPADDDDSIERRGYRAVHVGTVINKRGHLQEAP